MKKSLALLLLLLSAAGALAQNGTKSDVKLYQGEEFKPFLFDPYSATYDFRGNVLGLDFNIFKFSTRVFELEDNWEETQTFRLKTPDGEELNIRIDSTVDLKTGLLKKMTGSLDDEGEQSITFSDGRIDIVATDGKRTERWSYDNPDKIYPCYFSTVFMSYLPLDDNFSGSFTCFTSDETDDNAKQPEFLIQKLTLKVVGTERISTVSGSFDCYKLVSDVEDLKRFKNGKVKIFDKKKSRNPNEEKFWKNVYSNLWIDKKTRKLIKGEVKFKSFGSITSEMQKIETREL